MVGSGKALIFFDAFSPHSVCVKVQQKLCWIILKLLFFTIFVWLSRIMINVSVLTFKGIFIIIFWRWRFQIYWKLISRHSVSFREALRHQKWGKAFQAHVSSHLATPNLFSHMKKSVTGFPHPKGRKPDRETVVQSVLTGGSITISMRFRIFLSLSLFWNVNVPLLRRLGSTWKGSKSMRFVEFYVAPGSVEKCCQKPGKLAPTCCQRHGQLKVEFMRGCHVHLGLGSAELHCFIYELTGKRNGALIERWLTGSF